MLGHWLCSYLVAIEVLVKCWCVTKKGVQTEFPSLAHSLSFPIYTHGCWCQATVEFSEKILHVCFRYWQLVYVLSIHTGITTSLVQGAWVRVEQEELKCPWVVRNRYGPYFTSVGRAGFSRECFWNSFVTAVTSLHKKSWCVWHLQWVANIILRFLIRSFIKRKPMVDNVRS